MFLFISETAHKLIFFVLNYVLKRHLHICVCVCGDSQEIYPCFGGFPGGSDSNEFACNEGDLQETQVRSLGQEDPLDKGMATHFSILAMDKGASWATVQGVTKNQTQLSGKHFHSCHYSLNLTEYTSFFAIICFTCVAL